MAAAAVIGSASIALGAAPAQVGRWDPVFSLPNVAVQAHVLPNGKVLFWGRRDRPDGTMDEHECVPQVWAPQTN